MSQLPSQRALRFDVATSFAVAMADVDDGAAAGGHAVYLPPGVWKASPLRDIFSRYPETAGLKIVRQVGSVEDGEYVAKGEHSHVQRYMLHSHSHLTLVANTLHAHGVGPRLYDLLEIAFSDGVRAAYVSEHVGGQVPNELQWEDGMRALRELRATDVLNIVAPSGLKHADFRRPDCNGNAYVDGAGRFQYVDFQNFVLGDYARFLLRIAREASEATHYGQESWLRGGRYLYQSVPGLNVAAKRDVRHRADVLLDMAQAAGVNIRGSVILDVGCNLGMLMAAYLRAGAGWCHGWDRAEVVPHTHRQMLAIGCTRFSLTACDLSRDPPLEADLAPFVARQAPMVISYLAVRRHLGWLRSLRSLPWRALLYEGHEGEGRADTDRHLAELCKQTAASVVATRTYRDGDSEPRELALLTRSP